MMIKDAKHARRITGQKPKEKKDIRSARIQAIYSIIKEKFEQFSHTASSEPFRGSAEDSAVLQRALDELGGDRSLKKGTEDALRKTFKRLGWPFPGEDKEDSSRKFGSGHGWNRELKKRVAELKRGSRAGGSSVVNFEPDAEAALAAAEEHLNKDSTVSDRTLQRTYKAIRKSGKGI